ncbi:MAG: ATP-grasp domain-containing protein [Candidatus Omnitrophica bacterium]|nr:ATP-grasp domain-containing protein [Candidatus Omnitrophota bacterium]
MPQKTALVTDGMWRKSLATVRGLAQGGVKVSVGERTWMASALFSRYADRRFVYPSVTLYPDKFLDWLEGQVKTGRYDVLITPEEETALLVWQNFSRFSSHIRFPLADQEAFSLARDKFKLLLRARAVGVIGPITKLIRTSEDFAQGIRDISFPLVLKPVISTGGRGMHYLLSPSSLNGQFKHMKERYGDFLMQEYIPGDQYYGVSVIFNRKNQMRSAFVHKKLRQFPVAGGASTYAVSVEHPELVELAETLLQDIGWHGPANIEFKIDARDGKPRLMEVNPRLWGAVQLAIGAGINVPFLLYQLAMTEDIPPTFKYATGVKFRSLFPGDWMHFFSKLSTDKKADFDVFRLFDKEACHATWSYADPLPFVGQSLSLLDYFTSKELGKFRG